MHVGKTGYIYAMDTSGNFMIHPTGEGKNFLNATDVKGQHFIKEMCERIGWKFYSPSFPFHGTLQDRQTITICRAKEEARPIEERRYDAATVRALYEDAAYRDALALADRDVKAFLANELVVLPLLPHERQDHLARRSLVQRQALADAHVVPHRLRAFDA